MKRKKSPHGAKNQKGIIPEKRHQSQKSLQKLSLSVGQFIRYWGFRKVHGAIWTQLYISSRPLSGTDLTQRLGLSKALMSPALEELCQYKLIREVPSPNEKTRFFVAEENINSVIRHILSTREAKMLQQIGQDFSKFEQESISTGEFNEDRVRKLGEMILSANIFLEMMLAQEDLLSLPQELSQ